MLTVSYYRNSISELKQKMSIKMQMKSVKEKADELLLLIDEEYIDRETSARKIKTDERKEMKLLMNRIRNNQVKNLIVYSRCRLARNQKDYMKLYNLLKEKNVNVYFAADYEFSMNYNPESELIERIISAINQNEAERIVFKLKDGKSAKAKNGGHAAGPINFGYKKGEEKNDDWKVINNEAEVIYKVFNLFVKSNIKSLSEFVRLVNNKGLPYRDKKKWDYQSLQSILRKPIYMGIRIYQNDGQTIKSPAPHLKIIEKEIWEKAQIKLDAIIERRQRKEKLNYLLKDLVTCGECGSKLKGKYYGSVPVYKCDNHTKIRVGKEYLENHVIVKANNYFMKVTSGFMGKIVSRIIKNEVEAYQEAISQFNMEINQLKTELANQGELLIQEEYSFDKYIQKQLERLREKQKLKQVLESKVYDIRVEYQQLKNIEKKEQIAIIKESLSDDHKVELLKDIVFNITLYGTEANITFKHPFKESLTGGDLVEIV